MKQTLQNGNILSQCDKQREREGRQGNKGKKPRNDGQREKIKGGRRERE
jgi:hypothetical protein